MTPKMQAQLIAVYKHFAKHPKRMDGQLSFVRQVDKCLTDHGHELWTEGEIVNQTGARPRRTNNEFNETGKFNRKSSAAG